MYKYHLLLIPFYSCEINTWNICKETSSTNGSFRECFLSEIIRHYMIMDYKL